jgi:hypothetical protein
MTTTNQWTDRATIGIRQATPDDADHLHLMVQEIAAEEGDLAAVHTTTDHWRRMLARSEVVVLVAVTDGDPVGYVSAVRQLNLWVGGEILALDDLYLRPQFRNGTTVPTDVAEPRVHVSTGQASC